MFQDDLEELRQRFEALKEGEQPGPGKSSILAALDALRNSLETMQAHLAHPFQGLPVTGAELRCGAERPGAPRAPGCALAAMITIDARGCVQEFSAAAETLFGLRRAHAIGCELLELIVPSRLRGEVLAALERHRSGAQGERASERFVSIALDASGAEFPVEIALASLGIGDPTLLTVFVYDASPRRNTVLEFGRYQERLRSHAAALLLSEERERRHLAVHLHDGLSQMLALAGMKLAALRSAADAGLSKSLEEIESLIKHSHESARNIGYELSPPVLHDLGLEPALQWLVEHVQARYGIEVVLEDDGQPKAADEETRVILFRSLRELLIHAAKHAGARRVHLRLTRAEDRLDAAVEDDGVGLAADVQGDAELFGIRECLSHIGGSIHLESSPERGTRVRLCAPLRNETRMRIEA